MYNDLSYSAGKGVLLLLVNMQNGLLTDYGVDTLFKCNIVLP